MNDIAGLDVHPRWIYGTIKPYLTGRMLELNSGNGDISSLFVSDMISLRISDSHRHNYSLLKEKFKDEPLVRGIYRIDLLNPAFETKCRMLLEKFDTIIMTHPIDYSPGSYAALKNSLKLLKQYGYLIFQIPARTALYEESDNTLKYLRRANRNTIQKLVGKEIEIEFIQFFVIHQEELLISVIKPISDSLNHSKLLVPHFQVSNSDTSLPKGLSMIVIAKKTG